MGYMFVGLYFDSIVKIWVDILNADEIDEKCLLSILNRVVFYYTAYFFIVVRIRRVYEVNILSE